MILFFFADYVKFCPRAELQVGEHIVGAILGPGGKALLEIQHFSGANIQISKKGIYAPDTRNRWVTISGTPNAISTAQYLIEQRISEEEAKRARHHSNNSTTTTATTLNPISSSLFCTNTNNRIFSSVPILLPSLLIHNKINHLNYYLPLKYLSMLRRFPFQCF